MEKLIKFLVTFFGGIVISIIIFFSSFILCMIVGVGLAAGGMDIQSKPALLLLLIVSLIFIATPYSLIVTFVLYRGLSKVKSNKYGLLGSPIVQGAGCWIFNTFTLPYYLISIKYPPKYEELQSPPENYKGHFITGWAIGLILTLIIVTVQNIKSII